MVFTYLSLVDTILACSLVSIKGVGRTLTDIFPEWAGPHEYHHLASQGLLPAQPLGRTHSELGDCFFQLVEVAHDFAE